MPSVLFSGGGQEWGKAIASQRKGIREAGEHCCGVQPLSRSAAPMGALTVTAMSWPDAPSPVKDGRKGPG